MRKGRRVSLNGEENEADEGKFSVVFLSCCRTEHGKDEVCWRCKSESLLGGREDC
jgi:hypothetical protein